MRCYIHTSFQRAVNSACLEKYPINTLFRACFFGVEDLSYKLHRYIPGIKLTQRLLVKKGGNL
jgi:hypothetical protein